MPSNEWVDWPEEPGFYWFYGHTYYESDMREGRKPELKIAKAHRNPKGITVHWYSDFMYKQQAKGKFLRMTEPELPQLGE